MVEWPEGTTEPTKYWLSTMPPQTSIECLVKTAKLRWRIERDYQDLKQELGLGHSEGQGWRGFYHHSSLCIAAYGFLIILRGMTPPLLRLKPIAARQLVFPPVVDAAVHPIRPERLDPNSIATTRRRLTIASVKRLS